MNKKLILPTFALLLILIFAGFASAIQCESEDVLHGLRKALYSYYTDDSSAINFTADELKSLLVFYMGIEPDEITVDCTGQSDKIEKMNALPDKIPSCSDGTKYGKCSLNKPMYCFAGTLVPRCRLCGCPEGEWCDVDYVYTEKGNQGRWGKCNPGYEVQCSVDSDCGISDYIEDYFCQSGDVYRSYVQYTCLNPGEEDSSCLDETSAVLTDDCESWEECVEGQSECQAIASNVKFDLALRIADCATIGTDCEELYEGIETYGCALEGATVTLAAENQWNDYNAQLIVNSGEHSDVGDAPSGRPEWIKFKNIPVWTGTRDYSSDNGFYRVTVSKEDYTAKTGLVGIFGTTGSDLYWSREFIGNYICLDETEGPLIPDLIVEDLYYSGPYYIKVKYCNVGDASSESDFLIKLRNEENGKEFPGNHYYRFKVPAAGECKETGGFTCGLIGISCGDRVNVSAIIDWEQRVEESNENNNKMTKVIGTATEQDGPPTVDIDVFPLTVEQGQTFNVTVFGTDDVGLNMIWWWGVNTSDSELNKAHVFGCNGAKTCSYSWLVSTNALGTLTLGANSRDTAYPVPGEPHQASEGDGIAYATVAVGQVENWCVDSDSGVYPYIKGRVYGMQNGNLVNLSDSCNWNYIYERYCDGTNIAYSYTLCSYGCSDGACIEGTTICTDSDGGTNYYVKGTARTNNLNIEGAYDCCKMQYSTQMGDPVAHRGPGGGPCVDEGPYLYEAICKNNLPTHTVYTCPNGCKNGVC
ncbi:hypothetical protein KY347_04145 [Candidatus Woesearchaeota archaeon]|nr:hypothetical protein [Candidatus Woesearchaeota archaeon]